MIDSLAIGSIRTLVVQKLGSLGAGAEAELSESLLILDGKYCGRRFCSSRGYAIWLFDKSQIAIHDLDDQLIEEIPLGQAVRQIAA